MKAFLLFFPLLLLLFTGPSSYAQTQHPFVSLTDDLVPPGSDYGLKPIPPEDPNLFKGKHVAILASHGVEETEIQYPYQYLTERGATVDILVPWWTEKGVVTSNFVKNTGFAKANGTFRTGQNIKYDLLILTGGAWNAQVVMMDDDAKKLVRDHYLGGRPIAAICKGTEVLIRYDLTKGMELTGPDYAKVNLVNSGANFKDVPVVICRNLLTSRGPSDLVAFVGGLKTLLSLP